MRQRTKIHGKWNPQQAKRTEDKVEIKPTPPVSIINEQASDYRTQDAATHARQQYIARIP
jgi:hypothetical protein